MYRDSILDSATYDNKRNKSIIKDGYSYYVVEFSINDLYKSSSKVSKEFIFCLKKILKKYSIKGTILVIGLGNADIIGDSLGPMTISKLIATNHYDDFLTIPKIALFTPDVVAKTGISSYNLIKMLVKDLKPGCIIFIDSLKTCNEESLNKLIEINDGGIIPGSCLNINKEINKNTFNIPVIAIGVPLFLSTNNKLYNSLDVNDVLNNVSDIIANSLNDYFLH